MLLLLSMSHLLLHNLLLLLPPLLEGSQWLNPCTSSPKIACGSSNSSSMHHLRFISHPLPHA
jgi:hypothetical protein